MKRSMTGAMAAAMLLAAPAVAQNQNWLVGSWTLVSATQTVDGRDYMGPHPLGQIIFGPDGHFSNILLRSDLAKFAQNNRLLGTPEENTAVVKGSIAYFGTYNLTGDTLKMHITASTFPNWTGTDQARTVHLAGNQLIWENAAASGGGVGLKQVYERAKYSGEDSIRATMRRTRRGLQVRQGCSTCLPTRASKEDAGSSHSRNNSGRQPESPR